MEVLPAGQQALWPQLAQLPESFVLYGGTAIALQLGHRTSVDFDFFSSDSLDVDALFSSFEFLKGADVLQRQRDTLTVSVPSANEEVKLSFFGGISFGRVGVPTVAAQNSLKIASLLDLFGTKLKVLLQRVETKDYLDIAALLNAGLELKSGLSAASTLYGNQFPPLDCARALVYFEDSALAALSEEAKSTLIDSVSKWDETLEELQKQGDRLD